MANAIKRSNRSITPAYTFSGCSYDNLDALTKALASNWEAGKKQLYRGLLSGFFRNYDPEIAGYCIDAEEAIIRSVGKDDIVFWRFLYKLCPHLEGIYWKGETYESLTELGEKLLCDLRTDNSSKLTYWNGVFINKLPTRYFIKARLENESLYTELSAIEDDYAMNAKDERSKRLSFYSVAFLLTGERTLSVGDREIHSVSELADYMKQLLNSSYSEFEAFCRSMISCDDTLDAQLEAWLTALGKRNELDDWRKTLNG